MKTGEVLSNRLTGKYSTLVLHGFIFLVNAIKVASEDIGLVCKLLFLVFTAIKLRDSVTYLSMYHLTQENIL